jgi:putative lysine transport system ATP-binding protein
MSLPLFTLDTVSKSFGKVPVLHHITLSFYPGQVTCIIGASGSGKSTLLRLLNLLEYPTSGLIRFHEDIIHQRGYSVLSLRTKVAMVFQNFHLFPHLNVLQNCMIGPLHVQKRPRQDVEQTAKMYLEKVGMKAFIHASPSTLSGGQKQRVAIARALTMQADVLLFDEPTSALDPELVGEVLDVMKSLALEGRTMIIVTHEMAFARDVADRILFLDQGHVLVDGTPEDVLQNSTHPRLQEFLKRYR